MRILYSWLREFVPFEHTPEALKHALTMLGLEVSGIEEIGGVPGGLKGVVVGHVLSVEKHPNADRLRCCVVDIGAAEPLPIVCGAANVAAGQKVPVATIGTTLQPWGKDAAGAFTIQKGKIRGEVSMGMICAEDELGLGPDHEGIMVLDETLIPGTPFIDTLDIHPDYVLEVELTPNRVDAASHYGVARDLAALLRTRAQLPAQTLDPAIHLSATHPIPVTVSDTARCQRYTSLYITGVTVGESPDWLKKRIQAIGLRPINNVVDVTNYVLHELGQPMHAFDADQLQGKQVIVQTLSADTAFVTLEGTQRQLLAGQDLMICDAERPLCIGGVMGGLNSGVTEATCNIFLESAYFHPGTVRRTAKRLGLSTDSSFRFERGADPHMTLTAALRAAELIVQVAGGVVSAPDDQVFSEFKPFEVTLSVTKTQRLAGKNIPREEIIAILHGLEIAVAEGGDLLHLQVPPYRVDVQRDVDVMEDLLRVYGYNNVEIAEKMSYTLPFRQYRDRFRLREHYANHLSANGWYEILNNSLVPQAVGASDAVALLNPLSEDLGVMRSSMIYGVLETVRYNQNRQQTDLALYEFGKTYHRTEDGFAEREWLAMAVSGQDHAPHWQYKPRPVTLSTLTREIGRLQTWMDLPGQLEECQHEEFAYGLQLVHEGQVLVRYGKVAAALAERHDLRSEVFYLVADWRTLTELYTTTETRYRDIPVYPGTRRDLSLLLDTGRSFREISALTAGVSPLIRAIELHDVYQGKGIPEGKKSYLVSYDLRDDSQTLSDRQVDEVMRKITGLLERELGAEIRKG
ncbi:MAG: phenylalanine--tRNA ligase subunit beta [Bacteroidia bacterium]|nr:phenylalanine--tRNA ligase subunit beta [Bacteroidia bacterium]